MCFATNYTKRLSDVYTGVSLREILVLVCKLIIGMHLCLFMAAVL